MFLTITTLNILCLVSCLLRSAKPSTITRFFEDRKKFLKIFSFLPSPLNSPHPEGSNSLPCFAEPSIMAGFFGDLEKIKNLFSSSPANPSFDGSNGTPHSAEPRIMAPLSRHPHDEANFFHRRYCRAVRTLLGNAWGQLVRKGLMSSPPRRVYLA